MPGRRDGLGRRHRLALAACALLFAAGAAPPHPRAAWPELIGRVAVHPCGEFGALCGRLERPLDPRAPGGARIGIGFEYYRRRDRRHPALGLIVGAEGGPGYATTAARASYLTLFWPLLRRRDLLLMDNRGTGTSGAIECPALQAMRGQTVAAIGACGHSLGAAAALYGSGLAADDLAALLDALGAGKVDLYGDSYGTYFGQVFAARHPGRLRSLVLDGAYPVVGEDPFYPAAGAAVRRTLDETCRRAPTCRALPGTALGRIARLLDRLQAHPVTGTTRDIDGAPMTVTLDPPAIGNVLYDGTSGSLNRREIDAAARALLDADDPAPLLRLVAENIRTEGDGLPAGAAGAYSRGLNAAVSCMDYPQLYDMTAPPAARRAQAASRIAARQATDPGTYAPLSIAEWLRLPLDISVLQLCEDWPLPAPPYPPGQPVPPGGAYPPVPTLVLSGEMDILTTAEEGGLVAAQFPHARRIILANSDHVDAVGDTEECASRIVRRFVASGGDPGDVSCAARIRPLRLPPGFPRRAADMIPATPLPGNAAPAADRALAAAAVQTAGDALARWWLADGPMPGLRGGSFSVEVDGEEVLLSLKALRWTEDLAVSGRVAWDQGSGAVRARLTLAGPALSGPGGRRGVVRARWNDRAADARATLTGRIGGHALAAVTDAP